MDELAPPPLAAAPVGLYARELRALESAASRRALTSEEAVQRTELFVKTGEVASAIELSHELLKQRGLSAGHTCRLLDALGTSYFRNGDHGLAHRQYEHGLKLAQSVSDLALECRLRLQLFRHEVHWLGPEKAASDVSRLRRLVHHVGDPDISLQFQLGLVELAARLGLFARARRHLEIARTLTRAVDNKALHAEFASNEVALAASESSQSEAMHLARRLVPISRENGSSSVQSGVFTNFGHLLVAQARFDEALEWLTQGLDEDRFKGGVRVAIRDTLMMLHLARGAMDEAAAEAATIEQLIAEHNSQETFFALWHLVTRIKWLYRVGEINKGLQTALSAIARAEQLRDRSLVACLQLLAAEGLARTNSREEAVILLGKAMTTNNDPNPELVAEAGRVAGQILGSENFGIAASYFERASSILRVVGNIAAATDIERDVAELRPPIPHSNTIGATSAATITQRLALLADLGSHPTVVANEALSLLIDLDVLDKATVIEFFGSGQQRPIKQYPNESIGDIRIADDEWHVSIFAGSYKDSTYRIATLPKREVSARLTVLAVERLTRVALEISRARQKEREQTALWPEQPVHESLGLVFVSERMRDLVETLRRAAMAPLSILITGETGVGKELFARALHLASPRKDKTFLPFNCATVPKEMLDSQLFGHRKGAFTGAHETGTGVIRAADGGTLFLDEIGEMSMEAQPKLLRFLESGEIHPLGEPKPIHVDVRIVAATNANLEQLVSEGKFREDLYYRLNVLPIHIPPLRERREEVPALVEHFVEKFGREMQKTMIRVSDDTLEYLLLYRWPGNVRQLANEIRRMVALAEPGAMLTPASLSKEIVEARRTVAVEPSEFVMRLDQPLADATDQLERAAITRALTAAKGNNDQAAKILGLSRKGLYLKRQRLGLK